MMTNVALYIFVIRMYLLFKCVKLDFGAQDQAAICQNVLNIYVCVSVVHY